MSKKFYKEVLKNQIIFVCEEISFVRSATIGVWVDGGSIYEEEKNQGIAHFIEHMLFKGTNSRSAREISATIEGLGGEINAWTGKEWTSFYVKLPSEHIETAVELLSDIIQNSLFLQEDIETEKQIVLEEIRRHEDTPDEKIHDLFIECAFGNHPLGRSICGKKETILEITRDDIMNFYKTYYTPKRMIICLAGNIDKSKGRDLVAKYFSKPSNNGVKNLIPSPSISGNTLIKEKDTEQVHICIGTKGLPVADKERFKIALLNGILGGGMSSRLVYELREKRGLCYTVYSYLSSFSNCGLWTVYCGCEPKNCNLAIELILNELKKIKEKPPDDNELKKVKEQLKGGLIMSLENTALRMERLAKHEAYFKRQFTIDEIIAMIEKVSSKDIQDLANRLFSSSSFPLAVIGPIKKEEILLCNS